MPVPVAPTLTVIHGALLVVVQLHPVAAVTATDPLAPIDAVKVVDTGEIAETHDAPAWVTVKVCCPMVSVAVREVGAVLAVTL